MKRETDPKSSLEGLGNFVWTLPDRILSEVANNPLATSLGVISALSVFAKSPGALQSESKSLPSNFLGSVVPENILSWVLVSLAISFILSRLGAWIARRNFWPGLLFSLVFGAIAVLASSYFAVAYLAPVSGVTDPLLGAPTDFDERARVWHGLHVAWLAILATLFWLVNAISAYGTEAVEYVKRKNLEGKEHPSDTSGMLTFASIPLTFLSFFAFFALALAIFDGVAQSYVDQVLWRIDSASASELKR